MNQLSSLRAIATHLPNLRFSLSPLSLSHTHDSISESKYIVRVKASGPRSFSPNLCSMRGVFGGWRAKKKMESWYKYSMAIYVLG